MKFDGEVLAFDDIILVPQRGDIVSRLDVDLTMSIDNLGFELDLPIIGSPMDTVCEADMARKLFFNGGVGVIHRYLPLGRQNAMIHELFADGITVGAAVGATGEYLEAAESLFASGAGFILVDTANGHSDHTAEAVYKIRRLLGDSVHIMAGNIATPQAYEMLHDAGANSVRCGIGSGAACSTRLVSGHGMPTLQSVIDINLCRETYESRGFIKVPKIIADGGIKTTGDMVKAFAAGADAVMLGSLLAGYDESPGSVVNGQKVFRGMASAEAQSDWRGRVAGVEGVSSTVPHRGSVSSFLKDIKYGLGSGCSYSGVSNLKDLKSVAKFVRATSNARKESNPQC